MRQRLKLLIKGKKKKIKKNRYKTPESAQRKKFRLKTVLSLRGILSLIGAVSLVAATCGFLIISYCWITQTDWFQTNRIEITGLKRLNNTEVMKQAEIRYGMNIFEMNLSVIRKRLTAHPWISRAEVLRIIPDGIELRITEHVPVARVVFDESYVMNDRGVIFKKYSEDLSYLPVVEGLFPEDIKVFGRNNRQQETHQLISVLDILKIKDDLFLPLSSKKIDRIVVDREIGLNLYSNGWIRSVLIGYGDYPEKFKRLEDVVRYVTKKDSRIIIEKINLVNPDRIVIKPADDTETMNYSHKDRGGRHAST